MHTSVFQFCCVFAFVAFFHQKDIHAKTVSNDRWYEDTLEEMKLVKAVQDSMKDWQEHSSRNRFKRAENSICYGDLGCFEDAGPFGYLDMLPSAPEEIGTKFLVYSAKNRSEKPFLEFSFQDVAPNINASSTATDVDERKNLSFPIYEKFGHTKFSSVRVIVHGFGSSCPHVWIYELRSALMAVEDCLVICVDWENGAALPNYVRAATNTQLVGRQIAIVLRDLVEHNTLDLSKVHIIGFSLGAHVAGFAGALLPGLKRITGLDPAGPLFEAQHPKARLDDTDALYVDVVHSNGQNLILGGLGSWQPMGHVDFYPNGGRGQHGCSNLFVGAVTDIIWAPPTEVEGRSLCNHRRAYKFFIDSVAPNCQFPAFPCETYEDFLKGECFKCESNSIETTNGSACGNMGYYADKSTGRGQLYLKTREEEPFCAHQYRIRVHNAYHDLPLRTLGRLQVTLMSDGGLTEKFMITEKDDDELFAGEIISQIIVPHPALGYPKNISLLYTEYKGWLTRGLTTWSINKFQMMDSIGKTYSICKHMVLESQVPVNLVLTPGDCKVVDDSDESSSSEEEESVNVDETNETTTQTNKVSTEETTTVTVTDKIQRSDTNDLNTYFSSKESDPMNSLPWMPIIPVHFDTTHAPTTKKSTEIFEPIVGNKNNENKTKSIELVEPLVILKPKRESTGPMMMMKQKAENRTFKRANDKRSFEILPNNQNFTKLVKLSNSSKTSKDNITEPKSIMVQLFPYRIASMFEKAERYARQTILPYLTEQFPTFFKTTADIYDESDNDTNIIEDSRIVVDTYEVAKPEKRAFRSTSMRKVDKVENYLQSYKNLSGIKEIFEEKDKKETKKEDLRKIDLPTYKPTKETKTIRPKIYIPLVREPEAIPTNKS